MNKIVFCLICFVTSLFATKEETSYPIYDPYPGLHTDYCPALIYDTSSFDGHGEQTQYKMWHESRLGIALSTSQDGFHWKIAGETGISGTHPVVLYDADGFGGGPFFYKMWFWTGQGGKTAAVIQYTESEDGVTWTAPISVEQSNASPLVFGEQGTAFANLYGPGFILYNAQANPTEGDPYTFPYVMFYDAVSEGDDLSLESIGLAYSRDGKMWVRFGTPLIAPSGNLEDWDGTNAFRPYVIKVDSLYHMFYSGSNETKAVGLTVPYGHGIGHAVSQDGIHWKKDVHPLLIYSQGVEWRSGRTYRPMLAKEEGDGKCGL